MTFFLFRHGEKLKGGDHNPPLSFYGLQQAQQILENIKSGELPQPTRLWVSPKIRTHQTFLPVARHFQLQLEQKSELEERQSSETTGDFRKRIQTALEELSSLSGCIFMCTHMDWTEEAMSLIPSSSDLSSGQYSYWAPAQFLGFQSRDFIFEVTHSGIIKGDNK